MISFLQSLETSLEEDLREDVAVKITTSSPAKVPKKCQQLLSPLVIYAMWLVTNWNVVQPVKNQPTLSATVQELWHSFAAVLTLLVRRFPVPSLPMVGYLLPEDEDTLNFPAVQSDNTKDFWLDDGGNIKPRYSARPSNDGQNDTEELARIKTIISCGVRMALAEV